MSIMRLTRVDSFFHQGELYGSANSLQERNKRIEAMTEDEMSELNWFSSVPFKFLDQDLVAQSPAKSHFKGFLMLFEYWMYWHCGDIFSKLGRGGKELALETSHSLLHHVGHVASADV